MGIILAFHMLKKSQKYPGPVIRGNQILNIMWCLKEGNKERMRGVSQPPLQLKRTKGREKMGIFFSFNRAERNYFRINTVY